MKLAVLSDIHGNLVALETVLTAIQTEGVDQFICLGDVAAFGPQPRECLHRLRALNCPVVMGNTDAFLLNPIIPVKWQDSYISHIEKWCADQLSPEELDFVRTFQSTVMLQEGILAYHGSPLSYNDPTLPTTPVEDLDRYFGDFQSTLMLGGHTHQPMLRRYRQASILNPGSVGLALERPVHDPPSLYMPIAEYAILTLTPTELTIAFHRIPFNLDALFSAVQATDMPHQDWYIQQWHQI